MKKIIISIVAILITAAGFGLYFNERNERKRFEANYDTVVNEKKNAEILHTNEIEKFHKDIDSLMTASGIREKTVKTVFQTKINYIDEEVLVPVYDTIPVFASTASTSLSDRIVKNYSISKPCYDLQLTSVNDTISEKLSLHDKFTGFLYWERPHKFWFVRWGAKQYFMKIKSECMGEIIPEKLIVTEK